MGVFLDKNKFGHTGNIYVYKLNGDEDIVWFKTKDKEYLRIILNNDNFFISSNKISMFFNLLGSGKYYISDLISDESLNELVEYIYNCVSDYRYGKYCKYKKNIENFCNKNINRECVADYVKSSKANYRFLSKINDYKIRGKIIQEIYQTIFEVSEPDIILHCFKKKGSKGYFFSVFNITSSKYRVVVNKNIETEIIDAFNNIGINVKVEKEKVGKNWYIYFFMYDKVIDDIPIEIGIMVKNSFQSSSSLYITIAFKLSSYGLVILDENRVFKRKHIGSINDNFMEFIDEVDEEIDDLIYELERFDTIDNFMNELVEIDNEKEYIIFTYINKKYIFGEDLNKKISLISFINLVVEYFYKINSDEKTLMLLSDELSNLL